MIRISSPLVYKNVDSLCERQYPSMELSCICENEYNDLCFNDVSVSISLFQIMSTSSLKVSTFYGCTFTKDIVFSFSLKLFSQPL